MVLPKNLVSQMSLPKELHQVVKLTYHQVTYFFNRKVKIATAPTPNFDFVPPYLWERMGGIGEMLNACNQDQS